MLQALDAAAIRRWAERAVLALADDRAAIDRINVYPVADGDTGTNLLHTMRSAVEALDLADPATASAALAALAKGAVAGARGNSGMLLSQVLRGLSECSAQAHGTASADHVTGYSLANALVRAAELATNAVAEPARGTLLSVLDAAVRSANECGSNRLDVVVREATTASIRALAGTTAQLPALADAGVVDAGGRGLVVLLDTLHAVIHDGERLAASLPAEGVPNAFPPHGSLSHESRFSYEVMYLLSAPRTDQVRKLRDTLAGLGDCVSVISDGDSSWAVHVHCDDIGAAIESGIETGRVHGIQVVRFADQTARSSTLSLVGSAVLACVPSTELAELFGAEGVQVLPVVERSPSGSESLAAAIEATEAAHVVVLPNDQHMIALAEESMRRQSDSCRDVVVVPTASPVQGLAALAVHDPMRRRADDVVAMTEAAAATRRGEIVIATSEALTWAGHCFPGDVLGLVDGEVVLISADVPTAARDLLHRMLTAGGELVTLLWASHAPEELGPALGEHLRRTHPEVEVTHYPGGELSAVLLLGVE